MKRIICLVFSLLFFVFCGAIYAGGPIINSYRFATAPPSCATEQDTSGVTSLTTSSFHVGYTHIYLASKFIATSSYDVCKAEMQWEVVGSPPAGQTLHYEIWSHNSGDDEPDALIGGASDTYPTASITDGEVLSLSFSGTKPSLINGTTYWIVAVANNDDGTFSNHINAYKCSTTTQRIEESDDNITWTLDDTTKGLYFKLYS